jgi:hypothetical protein
MNDHRSKCGNTEYELINPFFFSRPLYLTFPSSRRCVWASQSNSCYRIFYEIFRPLLTYLLTPWCRVLLEKLTGLQLVKKFSAFHETRRFIPALTSVRHLSLLWASPIQSIYPHPTSWRSILILATHLRLGLPSGLQSKHPACECFLTGLFYREGLLAPRPAPKLEDHPSSAVRDCLFNLFAATLLIGGRSFIRNLRTRHAVVTGTH